MRKIKVNNRGSISVFNEQGRLHSFDGKPAYIAWDGGLTWYDKGRFIKRLHPNGTVTLSNR